MNIYELFEKIQAEKPEIFESGYSMPVLTNTSMIKDSAKVTSLDPIQLGLVPMEWLLQLDIFAGVEKIYIVHGPSFITDIVSGVPAGNSETFLGGDVKFSTVETYRIPAGETIEGVEGKSVALYCLEVFENDLMCTPDIISEIVNNIKPGAVLCKVSKNERVLILKYNIEKIADTMRSSPQIAGVDLIDKVASNVGNAASKLIREDVSNIGTKRMAKARFLILPKPNEFRTNIDPISEWMKNADVHDGMAQCDGNDGVNDKRNLGNSFEVNDHPEL